MTLLLCEGLPGLYFLSGVLRDVFLRFSLKQITEVTRALTL